MAQSIRRTELHIMRVCLMCVPHGPHIQTSIQEREYSFLAFCWKHHSSTSSKMGLGDEQQITSITYPPYISSNTFAPLSSCLTQMSVVPLELDSASRLTFQDFICFAVPIKRIMFADFPGNVVNLDIEQSTTKQSQKSTTAHQGRDTGLMFRVFTFRYALRIKLCDSELSV